MLLEMAGLTLAAGLVAQGIFWGPSKRRLESSHAELYDKLAAAEKRQASLEAELAAAAKQLSETRARADKLAAQLAKLPAARLLRKAAHALDGLDTQCEKLLPRESRAVLEEAGGLLQRAADVIGLHRSGR